MKQGACTTEKLGEEVTERVKMFYTHPRLSPQEKQLTLTCKEKSLMPRDEATRQE